MPCDEVPLEGILEIPWSRLDTATLDAILEEFVLREGTDYGEQEADLASKKNDVRHQLQSGRAKLLFDPINNSCQIELTERLIQRGWHHERS